jgi:signal transduction histidine kinase
VRDAGGEIVDFEWEYVNPKAAEILRRPVEDLIGQRLLQVLPESKTNSELFDRYVQVVKTGIPHDIEISYHSESITGWFGNMAVKLNDGIAISLRALEIIERNAKLQIQPIEDLLDVSRILRGKLSLNICPVNLVTTIEAALETVRLAASTKSIEIKTVYEPDVGQVLGDSGRLQQVIWIYCLMQLSLRRMGADRSAAVRSQESGVRSQESGVRGQG